MLNNIEELRKAKQAKHAAYMREWCRKNPAKKRANDKKYRAANLDQRHAGDRARYWKNREKMLEYNAAYRAANPEKVRAYQRKWYASHPDEVRRISKGKYQKNPELGRARVERRRALKLQATVELFTPADLRTYYAAEYPNVGCYVCTFLGNAPGQYEADDHIVALAKGGKHVLANLAPICRRHNASKGAKDLGVWLSKVAA